MDFLKRDLAPLSAEAWEEIDTRAVEVLRTHLTARRAVHVKGPLGWERNVVGEGRLTVLEEPKGGVHTGIYKVRPLVETRANFDLDRWEMDDITRGARDPDLDSLEDAMKKMALFEERTIYKGYEKGCIEGLLSSSEQEPISFGTNHESIMDAVSKAALTLRETFQEGPFTLLAGVTAWTRLHDQSPGYPLPRRVADLIGGKILYSAALENALLIPHEHEDLELTIGGDFSIGYVSHDSKKIRLFAAESFTFRVVDPSLVVPFEV